ncbi:MAG: hypothetical protein WD929_08300 [Steroidobacteraceae bacterium]
MSTDGRLLRIARYIWAAPCSAVGLVLGMPMLMAGGRARRNAGVIEICGSGSARTRRTRFGAITFGHVVIGLNEPVLDQLRAHELEHVRQYERWGPIFFLAYPAASLWQLLRGRNPYWFNHFEVQCRKRCAHGNGR